MYIYKNFSFSGLMRFTGGHIIWLTAWATFVVILHAVFHDNWPHIPWLPIAVIGTAVAFYVGFKNNSAYDRLWEARKIWGAIVNSSRMWGATVKGFVTNQFTKDPIPEQALQEIHKDLLYRHVAWLYALRSQLLIPTSWEHIRQNRMVKKATEMRRQRFGIGLYEDEETEDQLSKFLKPDELQPLIDFQNTATQIVDKQSQELKRLRSERLIDDFRHVELQKILNDLYTHQGKCERIKKFPLPRQYGSSSFIFIGIFIFLLPFGMISAFDNPERLLSPILAIPFTVLVGWVYLMMELVGDYSENPFEGLGNDIPMLALCRTIEIDLREMLGETDLPPKVEAKNGVLM